MWMNYGETACIVERLSSATMWTASNMNWMTLSPWSQTLHSYTTTPTLELTASNHQLAYHFGHFHNNTIPAFTSLALLHAICVAIVAHLVPPLPQPRFTLIQIKPSMNIPSAILSASTAFLSPLSTTQITTTTALLSPKTQTSRPSSSFPHNTHHHRHSTTTATSILNHSPEYAFPRVHSSPTPGFWASQPASMSAHG